MSHVSLREVRERRVNPNAKQKLVPAIVLCRMLSLLPTWAFIRVGVGADAVTYASFVAIFGGAALFVAGLPVLGAAAFFVFQILDCSDGDVARITGGSSYGLTLDSIGADLFYLLGPPSIGYFLLTQSTTLGPLDPQHVLLLGVGASTAMVLYRMLDIRVSSVLNRVTQASAGADTAASAPTGTGGQRVLRIYRNYLFRANVTGQPAITLVVMVLIPAGWYTAMAAYLAVLAAYHAPGVVIGFARVYIRFERLRRAG